MNGLHGSLLCTTPPLDADRAGMMNAIVYTILLLNYEFGATETLGVLVINAHKFRTSIM